MNPSVTFTTSIPPSVNHAYTAKKHGGRVLTSAAKNWMEIAGYVAGDAMKTQGWRFNEKDKLVMELWAYWPDNRRRDIHNLHKLIADAFEGILYKDDKMLLIRDMDFKVDVKNPRIVIVVREKEPEGEMTKNG